AGPVAAGYLEEVVDSAGEGTGPGAVAGDGSDETGKAAGDRGRVKTSLVVQDPRRVMHPAIGAADVRPEIARVPQGVRDQPAQTLQEPRHPPHMGEWTSSASVSVISGVVVDFGPGSSPFSPCGLDDGRITSHPVGRTAPAPYIGRAHV